MSPGNVDAILNNSYVTAIQDALGSASAWTRISISADASSAAPTAATAASSILSLSPLAQKIANGGEIALQVLDVIRGIKPSALTSVHATAADATPAVATPAGAPSSAPAVLAIEDAAKQALTDPKALFDALVSQNGGAAQWSQWLGVGDAQEKPVAAAEQKSFIAAFDSGAVTVQNAVTVKGLDYTDSTVIEGNGQSGGATVDQTWERATDAANGTDSLALCFPAVGGLYVTWAEGPGEATLSGES